MKIFDWTKKIISHEFIGPFVVLFLNIFHLDSSQQYISIQHTIHLRLKKALFTSFPPVCFTFNTFLFLLASIHCFIVSFYVSSTLLSRLFFSSFFPSATDQNISSFEIQLQILFLLQKIHCLNSRETKTKCGYFKSKTKHV